eukprot:SAG22_NODE_148_length_17459_cov_18.266359_1_plen_327_part_00
MAGGGKCTNSDWNKYTCTCKDNGWGGTHCTDDEVCQSNPCQNGGNCERSGKGYYCDCVSPFTGDHCEIDPCEPSPCSNDGHCEQTQYGDGYKCTCQDGYTGKTCDEDGCFPDGQPSCLHGGECKHKSRDTGNKNRNFRCVCKGNGWGPPFCSDDLECPSRSGPCQNGGECTNTAKDTDTVPSHKCKCKSGYSGHDCEEQPCHSNPCARANECDNQPQSNGSARFKCNCPPGFCGSVDCRQPRLDSYDDCSVAVCGSHPCGHGGTCNPETPRRSNNYNYYSCTCSDGWTGDNCDDDIDECLASNGGKFSCCCHIIVNVNVCQISSDL